MFKEFEGKSITEIAQATIQSPYMYIGLAVGYFLCKSSKKRR